MFKKFVTPALVLASLLSLGACKRESTNPAPARVQTEARAPQPQSCDDHFVAGQAPRITNPKLGNKTETLCFNVFSVLHSGITRTPLWSAEHLQAENIAAAQELSRENSFHSEARLPAGQRAELSDYSRSGYDRGHMAPNGDMPDRDSQRDSFSLANIVPQDGENNRHLWAGSFDRRYALGQLVIGARDITNEIMDLARANQADHHIIAAPHQLGGVAAQQQAGAEDGDADPGCAQVIAQLP